MLSISATPSSTIIVYRHTTAYSNNNFTPEFYGAPFSQNSLKFDLIPKKKITSAAAVIL
jgi:hypothetical protein